MKLREVVVDGRVEIYRFNTCLSAPDMFGAKLYRGAGKDISSKLLDREIVRIFDYSIPTYIVF